MLGLSVQAAWLHSLWSAGDTVILLWLFASLLINHAPLYTAQSDIFKLGVNKFIKLLESKQFCMHFRIIPCM